MRFNFGTLPAPTKPFPEEWWLHFENGHAGWSRGRPVLGQSAHSCLPIPDVRECRLSLKSVDQSRPIPVVRVRTGSMRVPDWSGHRARETVSKSGAGAGVSAWVLIAFERQISAASRKHAFAKIGRPDWIPIITCASKNPSKCGRARNGVPGGLRFRYQTPGTVGFLSGDGRRGHDGGTDLVHRDDIRGRRPSGGWAVLARRNPRLLLRFDGSFLLRYAERQLSASLFQEPPRTTRLEPLLPSAADDTTGDHPPPQAVAVGLGDVGEQAGGAGREGVGFDGTLGIDLVRLSRTHNLK